jgi:hypothetical protein
VKWRNKKINIYSFKLLGTQKEPRKTKLKWICRVLYRSATQSQVKSSVHLSLCKAQCYTEGRKDIWARWEPRYKMQVSSQVQAAAKQPPSTYWVPRCVGHKPQQNSPPAPTEYLAVWDPSRSKTDPHHLLSTSLCGTQNLSASFRVNSHASSGNTTSGTVPSLVKICLVVGMICYLGTDSNDYRNKCDSKSFLKVGYLRTGLINIFRIMI